jgi:hypothetical protein
VAVKEQAKQPPANQTKDHAQQDQKDVQGPHTDKQPSVEVAARQPPLKAATKKQGYRGIRPESLKGVAVKVVRRKASGSVAQIAHDFIDEDGEGVK